MSEPNNLTERSSEDPEESGLKNEKLRLEIDTLRRSKWLEWVKAFAAPVALVGVFTTLILGIQQSRQSTRSQDDARFDQAISRLAAPNATERITGVAGLELFLEPDQSVRHRATLRYLASALATEHDETVRAALLDVITGLRPGKIDQAVLDALLERLRDRNRSLYKQLQDEHFEKVRSQRDSVPGSVQNDETEIGDASHEKRAPLEATAFAIAALIRNGARPKDLSGIFCVNCDFSGTRLDWSQPDFKRKVDFAALSGSDSIDLSGANFDSAILQGANFIGVELNGATFDGADLVHADFTGADLKGARFTDFSKHSYFMAVARKGSDLVGVMPDFTCANLSGSDFTESAFFGIYSRMQGIPLGVYPVLQGADLSGAKLDEIYVIVGYDNPTDNVQNLLNRFLFVGTTGGIFSVNLKTDSGRWYQLVAAQTGPYFRFKEPVPPEYGESIQDVFSNLNSVKNVELAKLPRGLMDFLMQNRGSFRESSHSSPCTTRK